MTSGFGPAAAGFDAAPLLDAAASDVAASSSAVTEARRDAFILSCSPHVSVCRRCVYAKFGLRARKLAYISMHIKNRKIDSDGVQVLQLRLLAPLHIGAAQVNAGMR